jgi:uncharacterized protein YrrD
LQIDDVVGSHVFDLQTEKYLGKIVHPIIDYQEKKVLGFIFRRAFYYPRKAFEFSAIKKIHADFVIIEKDKAKLFFRKRALWKAYKKQREVITLKLVEDGKQVGKVFDFIVDDETGSIKTLLAEKSLFSDVFRIPVSKVKEFDVDAYVLEKDAVPKEEKEKPSIFTRVLTGTAKKIASVTQQSKEMFSEGQKNMLLGQVSPCDILSDKGEILLGKGQTVTDEILQKLLNEKKLGELTAAIIGSGAGTKYRSYKEKEKLLKRRSKVNKFKL